MNAENTYNQFLTLAKYWLKELDYYSKNQFKRRLTENSWSMGQIYDHLLNYTYDVHIKAIEDCIANKNTNPKGSKTFKGFMQFAYGGYFPMKYKSVPYIEPQLPLNTDKVKDDFYRFLKTLYKVAKDIDKENPQGKVEHPVFGYLTADEWFTLIYMHFKHHLRQKEKIDAEVRSNYKESSSGDEFDDIPDIPFHEER